MAKAGNDYEAAKALSLKGQSLRQISDRLSIPYEALVKYACRHKWTVDRTRVGQVLSDHVADVGKAHVAGWIKRIDSFVHRALDKVDPTTLGLKDLATAVAVADQADRMFRRAHGLDNTPASHSPRVAVQVNLHSADSSLSKLSAVHSADAHVIDLPSTDVV